MKKHIIISTIGISLILLSGCKSSDYKKASAAFDVGEYDEASVIFASLDDYKDSQYRLNESIYFKGTAAYNEGRAAS